MEGSLVPATDLLAKAEHRLYIRVIAFTGFVL